VLFNYQDDMKVIQGKEPELFSMPDGSSFYINEEVCKIPEAMFDIDMDETITRQLGLTKTVPQMLIDSVDKCDNF